MRITIANWVTALIAGFVFGLGLMISGLNNPAKIRAFLDVFGDWGPELIVVMGTAVIIFMVAFRLSGNMAAPLFARDFHLASLKSIDKRLVIGATLFGIGWGMVGLCPGPVLVNLMSLNENVLLFAVALLVGNRLAHYLVGPAK